MRGETDRAKLERFISALGERVAGPGTVFLTGGATALLFGWRSATIDIDIKADPEPAGLFEAIVALTEELGVNVELQSPDQFIPALPGWRERSANAGQYGAVVFRHYDFYAQALAKLQRRHDRDLTDVRAFLRNGLIQPAELRRLFVTIEPDLIRFPGIDAPAFRDSVFEFCDGAR